METKTISKNYQTLPEKSVIDKVSSALLLRGIATHYAENKFEALKLLKELIPPGAEVMTGTSATLEQIGFTEHLKSGEHRWKNKKEEILSENNKELRNELRKKSMLSEYFLVSVHAVTENGQLMVASNTGSQIPSIAFMSNHLILVVGAHKIVPTLEDGFKRIREYCLPLEDQHMKSLGFPGSSVSKILILEREINPKRKIELIFVNEVLGF